MVPDNRISAFEIGGNDAKSGLQVHEMGGNPGIRREIVQRMRVKLNKKNGCGLPHPFYIIRYNLFYLNLVNDAIE